MAYDYALWEKRAKKYGITPVWAALATLIFTPLGYWFNGDGFRGLKYTIILFFAGYLTLGVGTIVGAPLLAIDIFYVSTRHVERYSKDEEEIEPSKYSWLFKAVMAVFLIVFSVFILLITRLV